ncbi:hypothetical protein AB664_06020 [Brucella anthropi]|uniref:Uncharacterized protein n=1 Tax=Brucella anthropi TaxID=529 RepID=A0A656Z836_BRUAN|nr:hypothetical protein AB664_06020 [Brucella anthropi]
MDPAILREWVIHIPVFFAISAVISNISKLKRLIIIEVKLALKQQGSGVLRCIINLAAGL